jgi:hypothetical protein
MDTDALVEQSRARFAHEAARRVLREKYQAKLTFAHAGGMWRAGPELLTLLACSQDAEIVILDLYDNPVRVKVDELESLTYQRWQEQMQAWLVEYRDLSRER